MDNKRNTSGLRAWRQASGLTQAEAATILGMTQSYYTKLERHVCRYPNLDLAKRIMRRTGITLNELVGLS
jgi:transcriptional regulator with XRE-family HTH domain